MRSETSSAALSETYNHEFVLMGTDDGVDEFDSRLLLELEPVADAVAGIDEQGGRPKRQIAFRGELLDDLGLLGFNYLEIIFRQVRDKPALLIRNGEEHVDAGDVEYDASGIRVGAAGRRLFGLAFRNDGLGQQETRTENN